MSSAPAADEIRTYEASAPEPSPDQLDALLREFSRQPPGPRRAALRDHVIRLLLPMARRVTRRFQRHGEEFDDLVQVASLGLIKAVDGYDPTLGHAFLSYALPKVTGELRRHLRDRTAVVRLPRPLQEASGRIFRAVEELEQRCGGRPPTAEQIAEHTGLARDRVRSALRAVHECRARSLDEPARRDQRDASARAEGAEDPALGRVVDTVSLTALVRQLPERDRRVLYLRFYRECTQQQIARAVGVSQMQVSRILRRCLDRLREALEASDRGEPCRPGGGAELRRAVTGRWGVPCAAGAPGEPTRPPDSAVPARPTPPAAAHARLPGAVPPAAAGAVRRSGHGGGHPVRRAPAGPRGLPTPGARRHVPSGSRCHAPSGRRWRPGCRAAATCGERPRRCARPPPARAHRNGTPSPPGPVPSAPGGTDAGTRADEGAHREASPARAPARMALAGRPDPGTARP